MVCLSSTSPSPSKIFSSCSAFALSHSSTRSTLSAFSFTLKDPTLLPTTIPSQTSRNNKDDKEHANNRSIFTVDNPALAPTDNSIASLESMVRSDAIQAIQKSASALPSWRDGTTAFQRSEILSTWSRLIKSNQDDIAKIMTLESGKPLTESKGELLYGTSFLDYYAAEAIRPSSAGGGYISPSPFTNPSTAMPRGKIMAVQEAVGVTAMITPWNFPLAMITRKVGPALAVGCSVLCKPSELTPLTAIALRELGIRAGIPQDIFQLIISDRETTPDIGEEFCTNPTVKKISFTGSTAVGKHLMRMSSDTVKRLSLELGGNAPFLVFPDANLTQAIQAAMASKFRAAGQTCVCADRFIVHESIEEEFTSKLRTEVSKRIRMGDGMDVGSTTMGPLITREAADGVRDKISEALEEGAQSVSIPENDGDGRLEPSPNFVRPTILRNVSSESRIWKTETFGPVVAIKTFRTEEEALELANDSPSGLASYFCSQDMDRVFRVAGKLETGLVGINEGIISTATAPFGGVKESGLGREGSSQGIAEYLETKYMFLNV